MDQDKMSSGMSPELARLTRALRTNQNADDLFDELVVEFLGINRSDGRCLDIVDRLGGCTAGRLAAESGLTTGAVTALVDRMERAGYLRRTRDPQDRRKVWIETTELTRSITRMIWGHLRTAMRPLFERLSAEQVEAIAEFLEISTYVSRQRAALLQEHLLGQGATAEQRVGQAKAFEGEAVKLAECIAGEIRDGRLPHGFADPAAE
jgi:DNA-binding MarR family transcriptional regulator